MSVVATHSDPQSAAAATKPQNAAAGEYSRRLELAQTAIGKLEKRDSLMVMFRGLTALVGVAILFFWYVGQLPLAWLSVPVIVFVFSMLIHDKIVDRLDAARRKSEMYQSGLSRLNNDWSGRGDSGERYHDATHDYSADLDLFGDGSLFQLINASRTRLGKDRLSQWLLNPADSESIVERQNAVECLRNEQNLRESLALLDATVHDDFDQNRLIDWAAQPAILISAKARAVAIVLSSVAVLMAVGFAFLGWGLSPFLLSLIVVLCYIFAFKSKIEASSAQLDDAGKGLEILGQVLRVIERTDYKDPFLSRIAERVRYEGMAPSRQVGKLAQNIQYLNNATRNDFFAPIGILFCLPLHLVNAIEKWRATVGREIPAWLSAVAEFESIVSLSRFAYERPEYPFPEIEVGKLSFSADKLGHPLLNADDCIKNDVSLDSSTRMLMVSGSNMSGKSTLLRTIGINSVLAQAGAPVCADRMKMATLQVATAMRISDSLQQGKSLFFAVLNRLKRVVDLSRHDTPVLFLLDEILQGTNSHDRRIGAEAVIRSLLEQNSIGLVTTHDLALTEIASVVDSIVNVHFADQIENGTMTFDYQLRSGTVKKSNAIELMRLVGLDV